MPPRHHRLAASLSTSSSIPCNAAASNEGPAAQPELRLKDQDRDGVQAEILYGVLGSSGRLNDPEAALEMLRIYNDWLHDFCSAAPDLLVGLANLPNYNMEESVAEAMRCAKRGVRGLDIANRPDMVPLPNPVASARSRIEVPS